MMPLPDTPLSGRDVTAVLGPTNTGKTHYAIDRLMGHKSGMIGLPLRLLAREVYERIVRRAGVGAVELITGEERISPLNARYHVYTVEAMPQTTDVEFVAIDEVQIAANRERGHVFTDRLLHLRGRHETLLLGAATIQKTLIDLLPGIHVVSRPRMSKLTYSGSKKITRLPSRTAIVAFSTDEVYAIAELIRRQRGGAAVVLGSLSPRTRNAQVALYQSGEVDFLVATDAIGMGLNLDLGHVAFAQEHKFDGYQRRRLRAAEFAQIAGRAGRHLNDGTFGVTGNVPGFEEELVDALEAHKFASEKSIFWRNANLDFGNLDDLIASLNLSSGQNRLIKSPPTTDQCALELLTRDTSVTTRCVGQSEIRLLWDVCRIPDYTKVSPLNHSQILQSVFLDIADKGYINADWLNQQINRCDQVNGDIDAISSRLSHIRTWTYLSNHQQWLEDHQFWQQKTRHIEDKLSDALHQALTKRFIDRRTSVLMKRLRENRMLDAKIGENGEVVVEGHSLGRIKGFRFSAEQADGGLDAKAANSAAAKVLGAEFEKISARLCACPNTDIVLDDDGNLRWLGNRVARLSANEKDVLSPNLILLADEQLSISAREKTQKRLERWLANHIENLLRPLIEMARDQTLSAAARGLAFQIIENFAIIDRRNVAQQVRDLDQDARATLRKHGVRFGAYHIFIPILLKPAAINLICQLWALANDRMDAQGRSEIPQIAASGRTSIQLDKEFDPQFYKLCGYRLLGSKAVRVDILERLSDLIRPTLSWKEGGDKPEGAHDGKQFFVTPAMLSILGATHDDMRDVLKGLGYRSHSNLESDIIPQVDVTEADKPVVENTQVTSDGKATDPIEPVEPKKIDLWQRNARSNTSSNKSKQARKPDTVSKKSNKPPKAGKSKKFDRPEKKLDPDSPFAKLAALKQTMQGN